LRSHLLPLVGESGNLLKSENSSSTCRGVPARQLLCDNANDAAERLGDSRGTWTARDLQGECGVNRMATRPSSGPQCRSPRALTFERASMRLWWCVFVSHQPRQARPFQASSRSRRPRLLRRGWGLV